MKQIIAVLFLVSFAYCLDDNNDLITNLPGLNGPLNFKQYSGYIQVAPSRHLFYWFVESQRNPATDKLVLWLNGGPGCSSVAGLMTENGPFRVNSDGSTISMNPHSWNKVANVIYLESPAGVGFSYSTNQSDYYVGDWRTAEDSYNFLQAFLTKFPQYRASPFWITGESYAGHYVPELAERILEKNQISTNQKINLEGIMAGNAWTYMPIDNYGAIFYWWTHALISDFTFNEINNKCNLSDVGPLKSISGENCDQALSRASQEMGNINIYDIYVDVCASSQVVEQLARAGSPVHQLLTKINPPYLPCADSYTSQYLNKADVQAAIHANIDYSWRDCSNLVHYNYSDVKTSVIPVYQNLFKNGVKILVYSGDVDAIVPVTGTRTWIASLKRPILENWKPYTVAGQVGGYVTVYDTFTFATVRNAGHMVPQTQPERAQYMFENFLYKQHL